MKIALNEDHPLYQMADIKPAFIYVCNACSKQCPPSNPYDDFAQNLIHSFKTFFGYGSAHDMDRWSFDICESCLLKWVSSFNIVPEGFEAETAHYNKQEPQHLFDEWKTEENNNKLDIDLIEEHLFDQFNDEHVTLISIDEEDGQKQIYYFNFKHENKIIHFHFIISPSIQDKNLFFDLNCYEIINDIQIPYYCSDYILNDFLLLFKMKINKIYYFIEDELNSKLVKELIKIPEDRLQYLLHKAETINYKSFDPFLEKK
jgi:hypothetical protein